MKELWEQVEVAQEERDVSREQVRARLFAMPYTHYHPADRQFPQLFSFRCDCAATSQEEDLYMSVAAKTEELERVHFANVWLRQCMTAVQAKSVQGAIEAGALPPVVAPRWGEWSATRALWSPAGTGSSPRAPSPP